MEGDNVLWEARVVAPAVAVHYGVKAYLHKHNRPNRFLVREGGGRGSAIAGNLKVCVSVNLFIFLLKRGKQEEGEMSLSGSRRL